MRWTVRRRKGVRGRVLVELRAGEERHREGNANQSNEGASAKKGVERTVGAQPRLLSAATTGQSRRGRARKMALCNYPVTTIRREGSTSTHGRGHCEFVTDRVGLSRARICVWEQSDRGEGTSALFELTAEVRSKVLLLLDDGLQLSEQQQLWSSLSPTRVLP